MDIAGKLIVLEDTVQISDKFRKREFVVEYATNPAYPEFIKFEIVQDKCAIMDSLQVGQDIVVFFDVRGRKWVDKQGVTKYFNSLNAWRVVPSDAQSAGPEPPLPVTSSYPTPEGDGTVDTLDDIPF